MRLGFWPPVYGNWIISPRPETCDASFTNTKKLTLLAQEIGFETLLLAEHFVNPSSPELDQLDAWSTASALAAVTDSIEIIAAVKPGFRAPGIIAKAASNIDHISQGRFAINLVSAWWLPEFEMLGVETLPHDERYARSEEYLTIIKESWIQDEFSFEGKFFSVKGAKVWPKPVQQPHPPIYIGGESEAGRNFGARMADIFLINGRPLSEIKEIIADVSERAAKYERALQFGISAFVICRDSEGEAMAEFERLYALRKNEILGIDKEVAMLKQVPYGKGDLGTNGGIHAGLVGTPSQIADRMRAFESAGVETFMLQFHPLAEEMERFGEQVMPLLN
jgi:alkanesulfonate monooxygenase